MSPIASPPSASITATSANTRPRSWTGTNRRRAIAFDNSPVSPVRSANMRSAMLPACATTPTPSPDTTKPDDHEVAFTNAVPSRFSAERVVDPADLRTSRDRAEEGSWRAISPVAAFARDVWSRRRESRVARVASRVPSRRRIETATLLTHGLELLEADGPNQRRQC
jgi:hypothetical protein